MVPALLGFQGRALVIDPDVFALADVFDLMTRDMGGKAILCRRKPEPRDGKRLYSSAVMLLDCSKLGHWDWEHDIDEIFAGRLQLGPWLSLLDEPPEHIGLFENEWNDHDTLTERTKLLHNTNLPTQPWKTGLPVDYEEYAVGDAIWINELKKRLKRVLLSQHRGLRYSRHPDARQEQLFFTLLKGCVEEGSITPQFLQWAIRKRYLRSDALSLLETVEGASAGAQGWLGE